MSSEQKKLKVLLVDDDSIFQFLSLKILQASGLTDEVMVCSNGQEAIQLIEDAMTRGSGFPDVIFLDINMPIMNGWEFLESFEKKAPSLKDSIPVYIVSSSANQDDKERAKEFENVTDYLIKPIMQDQFRHILTSLSDQKLSRTSNQH